MAKTKEKVLKAYHLPPDIDAIAETLVAPIRKGDGCQLLRAGQIGVQLWEPAGISVWWLLDNRRIASLIQQRKPLLLTMAAQFPWLNDRVVLIMADLRIREAVSAYWVPGQTYVHPCERGTALHDAASILVKSIGLQL